MSTPAPSRILVVHTAFLGDLVIATSFLANLRALAPAAEIRFLTNPVGAKLLEPNSMGVQAIAYDKRGKDRGFTGFLRQVKAARLFRPELVFCLHRSVRSSLLARLSGGETWGFAEAAGAAMLDHRVPRANGAYEAEKNHALLEAWAGAAARGMSLYPQLMDSSAEREEAARLLAGVEKFVAIAPSSVWATKRWPAESFAEVARLLWEKRGLRTVVVGGQDAADLECAARLVNAYGDADGKPLNFAGKTGLGTLKSVLSRSSLAITNDSAPLHVAIAMGAPVLAIFGPTTREIGFFPYTPAGRSGVVEHENMPCRPCGLHGHHECPLRHFRCMLEISPERVFAEAVKLLGN